MRNGSTKRKVMEMILGLKQVKLGKRSILCGVVFDFLFFFELLMEAFEAVIRDRGRLEFSGKGG